MGLFLKHPHWQGVEHTLKTLQKGGFKAYLVGGCVRDVILSRNPKDFDIVTNATPEEVEKLFPSVLPLGKAFFAMSLPFPLPRTESHTDSKNEKDKKKFYTVDIVTFRSEKGQVGHRYPKEWVLATPEEDLLRRDFTMNALLLDLKSQEVLDLTGGMEDLKRKRVVCIGQAKERFHEDALRMLRAFRFASELGFHLEANTEDALAQQVSLIQNISKERVTKELEALLKAPYLHKVWESFVVSGMASQLMPDLPWEERDYRSFLGESWRREAKEEKPLPSEVSLFLFRLAVLQLPLMLPSPSFSSSFCSSKGSSSSCPSKGFQKEELKLNVMKKDLFTFWNRFSWSAYLKKEWISTLMCLPLFLSENLKLGKGLCLLHRWPMILPLLLLWMGHQKEQEQKSPKSQKGQEKRKGNIPPPERFPFRKRIQYWQENARNPLPEPFVSGKDLLKVGFPPKTVLGQTLKKSYYLQLEKVLLSRKETLNWLKKEKERIGSSSPKVNI